MRRYSAQRVLQEIECSAPHVEYRQLAVIDRDGNAVARTGAQNTDWSGAFIEPSLVSLGNGLISERTASAMFDTYKEKRDLPFEERLMSALESARDAGGQHGGQHSSDLVVYSKQQYSLIDLRVDFHDEPIGELRRLYNLYAPRAEYFETRPWQPAALGREDEWMSSRAGAAGNAA